MFPVYGGGRAILLCPHFILSPNRKGEFEGYIAHQPYERTWTEVAKSRDQFAPFDSLS